MIRTGATRLVFLVGPWAIKVPILRFWNGRAGFEAAYWGWRANRNETAWAGFQTCDLAEVRWGLSGLLVVMERTRGGVGPDDLDRLAAKYPGVDVTPANVGMTADGAKIHDFGDPRPPPNRRPADEVAA